MKRSRVLQVLLVFGAICLAIIFVASCTLFVDYPLFDTPLLPPNFYIRTWRATFTSSDIHLDSSITRRTRKILYWGSYFGDDWKASNWPLGEISCPNNLQCVLTDNDSEYATSDAVIFHSASGTKLRKLPRLTRKLPNQAWVYLTLEPPPYAGKFYRDKNIMNLTMTYLGASDVLLSYGDIEPGVYMGGFNQSRNYLQGKTRSAVAIISNCQEKGRLNYVKALSKYIDVDIFGRCGHKQLCHNCWDQLQHYKFYLAFENNICVDYVTEKLYDNGLSHGMVPVVLGGANYSNPLVAPPGSYINARDFTSVKSLADFLKVVGSDSHRYNQYFRWLSSYQVQMRPYEERLCKLCAIFNQNKHLKTYVDVLVWYKSAGYCEQYPNV